jgi:hypothetical protein
MGVSVALRFAAGINSKSESPCIPPFVGMTSKNNSNSSNNNTLDDYYLRGRK